MTSSIVQNDLEFFTALFDNLPVPVWVKDHNHCHVFLNDAFCRQFNVVREHLIGKSDMLNYSKKKKQRIWEAEKEVLRTGIPNGNTIVMKFQDGKRHKIIITKTLITTEEGKLFILAVLEDITEQDSLLKNLRSSESLYKALVNKSPNLIILHIREQIVFANDAVIKLTGHNKHKVIGKSFWEVFREPSVLWRNYLLKELFTDKHKMKEEVEIQAEMRPGIKRNFILRSSKINYKSHAAVMSILTDITRTMNIENLLLTKTIETEEADRKRFAADLHDDLGPILSSIKLHLELLQRSGTDDKQNETIVICMELLKEAIEKMSLIANNLMPRLIENHGLEAALRSFCKSISKEGLFYVDLISDLGITRFTREIELHFFRIITELINNTIKHSGAKKASVRLSFSEGLLSLNYMDNGKGYTLEESMIKSSGRGLSNIFHRVNLIKGQVEFNNRPNGMEVQVRKLIE